MGMCEKTVGKRKYEHKRETITGSLRFALFIKYYGDQIKKNAMGWKVARIEIITNSYKLRSENLYGRSSLGNKCLDGRVILKWILKK
jgi:hypothetical protein